MQGLDFRKKRGKKVKKPGAGRKRAARGGLRFETEKKRGLHFAQEKDPDSRIGAKDIILWIVEILIVCMAAVLLVAAFGQRVSIAGDSMAPVLKNGNVILINRAVYHFKDPARGDIIAFSQTGDRHDSVKRIVGLPGETVQITDGKILIDGEELTTDIYVSGIEYAGLAEEPIELGNDEYFVMGDNGTSSDDSRDPGTGNVKREDIRGEAWFVVSPSEDRGPV